MLNTYTSTNQTVAANETVKFTTNGLFTSSCINHPANSDIITLNRSGYYKIDFYATGTATASTATSPITFQLYKDNSAVTSVLSSELSATNTDTRSFNFTTVIRVKNSCPMVDSSISLKVVNTGEGATLSNANFIVTRL